MHKSYDFEGISKNRIDFSLINKTQMNENHNALFPKGSRYINCKSQAGF